MKDQKSMMKSGTQLCFCEYKVRNQNKQNISVMEIPDRGKRQHCA